MKHLILLLLAFALAGCATTQPVPPPDTRGLVADELFAPPKDEITADDLFTATPAMVAYVRSSDFQRRAVPSGPYGLMNALYTRGELMLEYDANATRPAGETFERKSGNCLSLLIMTAAFARELGLEVTFQQVVTPDSWSRSGELYFSNHHVNLALGKRTSNMTGMEDLPNVLVVDFLPPEEAKQLRVQRINESTVVAMYLNNRAAEALSENRLNDAYWWARKAVVEHPSYTPAINLLAVVYHRRGHVDLAERTFRIALEQEPEGEATLSNLRALLTQLGKHQEAQLLTDRLAALGKVEPFHYFRMGMDAMQRQDYQRARDMFRKEVARAPYNDEFHYWLGLAYQRLGDQAAAREEMTLAIQYSTTIANRSTYSSKLQFLKSLRGTNM